MFNFKVKCFASTVGSSENKIQGQLPLTNSEVTH